MKSRSVIARTLGALRYKPPGKPEQYEKMLHNVFRECGVDTPATYSRGREEVTHLRARQFQVRRNTAVMAATLCVVLMAWGFILREWGAPSAWISDDPVPLGSVPGDTLWTVEDLRSSHSVAAALPDILFFREGPDGLLVQFATGGVLPDWDSLFLIDEAGEAIFPQEVNPREGTALFTTYAPGMELHLITQEGNAVVGRVTQS